MVDFFDIFEYLDMRLDGFIKEEKKEEKDCFQASKNSSEEKCQSVRSENSGLPGFWVSKKLFLN